MSAPAEVEEKPAPAAPPASPRGIRRMQIGFNVLLQILIVAMLVSLVNYLGFRHYKRFDFSRDRKYALSERTKQFLAGLNKPVKLIVFMSDQALLKNDALELAREYRQVQPNYIQFDQVDPFREPTRAAELGRQYPQLKHDDNVIILDCEGRQKIINQEALADFDRSGEMFNQPAQITAFKGEQAITGALIEIVEGKKNLVYYLRGQAQPELGAKGPLSGLEEIIQRDNIELKDLNLLNAEAVPADASAVWLAGANYDISEREATALEAYWSKQGRLLILLNPDASTPHLAAFLDKIGIHPTDDRVTAILRSTTVTGAATIERAPVVVGETMGSGPITGKLKGVNLVLPGSVQSLTLEPARARGAGVRLEPLMQAMKGFWGEVDYRTEGENARFTPGRDKDSDLILAVSAERGAPEDGRVQVGGSRLLVIGSARFIANGMTDQGSADFFLGGLNWLLDRERLIGIPPKEMHTFSVNFTEEQTSAIFWLTVIGIPAGMALLGLLVWWRRS